MMRQVVGSIARRPWLRKAAISTPLLRDVAWRFVAGEDLAAGLEAVRTLRARGIAATLNHVGTHVRSATSAVAAADAAIEAARALHAAGLPPDLSVKLTQLGLDVGVDLCRAELARVLDAVRAVDGFVRIDMEESRYVAVTLTLFEEARRVHGDRVGIVLQSYLRRTGADLDRLLPTGASVRLVKGGYWETGEALLPGRSAQEAAFHRDLRVLIQRGRRPALATHDEAALARAREALAEARLDRGALDVELLYGVRTELQAALVREGFRVKAYVPYGEQWYEYVLGCVRQLPGGALRRIAARLGGAGRGGRA